MDLADVRRRRLRIAIDDDKEAKGVVSTFARKYGVSASLLNRYLNTGTPHSKAMREKAARNLEQHIRKPPGWLDCLDLSGTTPQPPAASHLVNEQAAVYHARQNPPRIDDALAVVAHMINRLPRAEREQLRNDWTSLLSAPDSPTLRASISEALGSTERQAPYDRSSSPEPGHPITEGAEDIALDILAVASGVSMMLAKLPANSLVRYQILEDVQALVRQAVIDLGTPAVNRAAERNKAT